MPKHFALLACLAIAYSILGIANAQTLDNPISPDALNARVAIEIALAKATLTFPEEMRLPSLNGCCLDEYEAGKLSDETLADIKSAIDANHETFAILDNATKLTTYRGRAIPDPVPAEIMQQLGGYRNLARRLYDASAYYAQVGQTEESLRSIELIYWLADTFARDEFMIYGVGSRGLRSMASGAVDWLKAQAELGTEQASRVESLKN